MTALVHAPRVVAAGLFHVPPSGFGRFRRTGRKDIERARRPNTFHPHPASDPPSWAIHGRSRGEALRGWQPSSFPSLSSGGLPREQIR